MAKYGHLALADDALFGAKIGKAKQKLVEFGAVHLEEGYFTSTTELTCFADDGIRAPLVF